MYSSVKALQRRNLHTFAGTAREVMTSVNVCFLIFLMESPPDMYNLGAD